MPLEGFAQRAFQPVPPERLGEEIARPGPDRFDRDIDAAVGGYDQDRGREPGADHMIEDDAPVHVGQLEVQQNGRRRRAIEPCERRLPGIHVLQIDLLVREEGAVEAGQCRLILDDQHIGPLARRRDSNVRL